MIEQLFEVATEFRFDIGQAMIGTQNLSAAVDDLSKSAQSAMGTLNYLAGGLVSHLGLGAGGLLGVLTKAVSLSEEFNSGAFGFVNSISGNFRFLDGTINTFNDKLGTSKMIMDSVNETASGLGLNSSQLAMITQQVAGPLAARKQLGTNYEGGIKMAKNIMIGSEAMGLNPMMMQESMIRGMQPGQAVGGKVFERFMGTKSFQDAKIMHPQQIANMQLDKKFKLLSDALQEVGGNADYLAARSQKLSVQFEMLKGQFSKIIKPIGDAIGIPLRKIFTSVIEWLQQNAGNIGQAIGKLIGNVFENPEELFKGLFQLKRLGGDFKKALHFTEVVQSLIFLKWVLGLIGIKFNGGLIKAAFGYLFDGFAIMFKWLWKMDVFGGIFLLLWEAVAAVVPWLAMFLVIFQGLSRARAQAAISDIKAIGEMTPKITAAVLQWKAFIAKVIAPFQVLVQVVANIFEPLFRLSTYMSAFLWITDALSQDMAFFGEGFIDLAADIAGFFAFLSAEVEYIMNLPGKFMNALTSDDPLKNLKDVVFSTEASDAWAKARKDFLDTTGATIGKPGDSTTKYQVTNNNHVEARFDMREQMEPDRIAFAVTSHLKKLAMNPTQGRGQSFSGGLVNPQMAGG